MIGRIAAARRALPVDPQRPGLDWSLRWLPVCASTEPLLERWLAASEAGSLGRAALLRPRAVIARRQRHGRGQLGRLWQSPAGGVWLSAALPWPAEPGAAASLSLAVAEGLARQLEPLVSPRRLWIKWPNDLLLAPPEGAASPSAALPARPGKLAGLLPRLRLRGGRCRWAQVGVGLNGVHAVPPEGTPLAAQLLPALQPWHLAARVLAALEWAVAHASAPALVRDAAQRRLWLAAEPLPEPGWRPLGLGLDGALLLGRGGEQRWLRRSF